MEYVELDPRVYKSDYLGKKFQPMPRKKRGSDYAVIDTKLEDSNDRLIWDNLKYIQSFEKFYPTSEVTDLG